MFFPNQESITSLDEKSATLSWDKPQTTASVSSYICEYKKDSDAGWTTLASQTATTYTLSGLTGLTTYNFRVKAKYDDGGESFYQSTGFTTLMSLPYECGFENGMNGWREQDINYGYTGISTAIVRDGQHSYEFVCYDKSHAKPQYLISPPMPATSAKTVSFFYRAQTTGDDETFQVKNGGRNYEETIREAINEGL